MDGWRIYKIKSSRFDIRGAILIYISEQGSIDNLGRG